MSQPSTPANPENYGSTLLGHPTGLYTLFFAEMWERFSFYGMRALLLFYMLKGFGYLDSSAYAVFGAYTALVYMTPFFGGMLADRLLGARRGVVLGGLLMAAGHLMMTIEQELAFYTALALLIAGNGFFKPNISTIVGSLYPPGSPKRDRGFTIFYMGINLGAAFAPLLCGYVGQTYGWHYGFGLATIGMLTGVAVFVAPSVLSQLAMYAVAILAALNVFFVSAESPMSSYANMALLVLLVVVGGIALMGLRRSDRKESALSTLIARIVMMSGAVALATGVFLYFPANLFSIVANYFVGIALLIAAVIAWVALGRGGLPMEAGAPPDPDRLRRPVLGPLSAEFAVYLGALVCIPLLALLVSSNRQVSLVPATVLENLHETGSGLAAVAAVFLEEMSKPTGLILLLCGIGAFVYLGRETFRQQTVARQRMYVVLILTFFSMLFWAFFEQAGSSINNFTDRNVDRVFVGKKFVTESDVGKVIEFRVPLATRDKYLKELPLLSQEQFAYKYGNEKLEKQIAEAVRRNENRKNEKRVEKVKQEEIDKLAKDVTKDRVFTVSGLTYLREIAKEEDARPEDKTVEWEVTKQNVGMAIGGTEMPATLFLAVNPIYILLFGSVFSLLWTFLGSRGIEPSTPVKFSLGLFQLGLGFAAIWYGAQTADERGMVALSWLFLGYLLHTTGELCLSPVGLSMVTKLSPAYLVSTVMGMWFLATAFSQFLAAIIAQFTGVGHGGGGGLAAIPVPSETVHVYGDVFGIVALTAIASGFICLFLSPLLTRWMHEDVLTEEDRGKSVADASAQSRDASEHLQVSQDDIKDATDFPPHDMDTSFRDQSDDR